MNPQKHTSKRKKFENNWLSKSLENLEKDNWGAIPKDESYLVTTCHELRKSPIGLLEIEDLRILIGQNIGLPFLIPLALQKLNEDILAEGDYYEGDLLHAVLCSDPSYWKIEKDDWKLMINIYNTSLDRIKNEAYQHATGRKIKEQFDKFKLIN